MTIKEIQEEIIEEFSLFENKQDQYQYIIELGKKLPELPESDHVGANIIKGCQSQVWLTAKEEDGTVFFLADSDSTLVKGLISLLVRVFSQQKAIDIFNAELFFIEKIDLKNMLSMNRSNGLASMVKQMKFYALAFQSKEV